MKKERFNLLGEFQYISRSGQAGEIDLAKNIGVLAVLLLSKDFTCTRGKLIELLWSDRCSDQGRASLRHSLWSLKKMFSVSAPDLLRADRKKVGLDAALLSTDVAEFFDLSLMGDPRSLEQAVALYRGELLDGLSIRDRRWKEWLGNERDVLQLRHSANLCELCAHYRAAADAGALLAAGRQLLEHDRLSEDGQRAMMNAYLLLNQRSRALKQYRDFAGLLRLELNGRPGPAISALYEKIKTGAGIDEALGKRQPLAAGTRPVPVYESSYRVGPVHQAAASCDAALSPSPCYGVQTACRLDEPVRPYRIDLEKARGTGAV